jgi:TM2 domain-containing membrane protein YozV
MEKANKAAIFSAVLFPGWGQLYLGHIVRGLIFMVSTLAGSLLLAWMIIRASIRIIKNAPFMKGSVRLENIIDITVDALRSVNITFFLLIMFFVIALWVLSIVDSYQLGKKQDLMTATDDHQPAASVQGR